VTTIQINNKSDIMKELRKSLKSKKNIEPNEGQRELLRSSKDLHRCPSLGFISNNNSESVALDYLASVLVEAFLDTQEYERNNTNNKQ
jgi:hypothetical protein